MRRKSRLQQSVITLALLGVATPQHSAAGIHDEFPHTRSSHELVRDVQLSRDQMLEGVVIDAQGNTLPQRNVLIRLPSGRGYQARTDADGRFRLGPLRGGMYHLSSGQGAVLIRAWKHATSPPAARSFITLSADQSVTRGQGPLSELLTYDPVLFGIIIAAAIAIPVAVHNSKSAS